MLQTHTGGAVAQDMGLIPMVLSSTPSGLPEGQCIPSSDPLLGLGYTAI